MALNTAAFKTRTITAAVFVVVMMSGLLWNSWSFLVLFSLIHFGCWREYQQLVSLIDKEYANISPFHRYGVMLAGWCFMLYFTHDAISISGLPLHAIGWWTGLMFVFVLPIIELLFARNIRPKNIAHSVFGLIYISLSWALMMDLRGRFDAGSIPAICGKTLPLIVIFSIWINDTMAYIVGSLIGKTPFSSISPKKTWEGTLGGIILCVIVMGLLGKWWGCFEQIHWFMIAAISAIAGTAGDLLESKLKRLAGVKDSGSLMPGHGGFLDRFDSLLVAIPFVWLYVIFFMR